MPQLIGVRLRVGKNADFPNVVSLRRRLRFQNRRHSTACRAPTIRGSANCRNRDTAQGDLGHRGQEILLPRMLFLSRESKEVKNQKSKEINITTVNINQTPASEELSTIEILSISEGSWLSSSVHFAIDNALANQNMANLLTDFGGHFGFEAYRSAARQ